MRSRGRLARWRRRRRRGKAAAASTGAPLREFVYLDDVSVYSLTASRLGSIATEFTDTETSTLGGEVESSLEGLAGIAKGSVRAKSSASREQSSQVLRKSIVQTAFKDLYDLEADRLVLTSPQTSPPTVRELVDVENLAAAGEWVVRPQALERGRLIEVEVDLEAEAVFRINAVVSAFVEIVQEDQELFGISAGSGVAEAQAMSRVLDKLLTGLVPLRGRAVDFVRTELRGSELIVHRAVLDQLPASVRPKMEPLMIVGVAEQRLFWKDIRRVLFSNSRFRLFCRVSRAGLHDRWTPVKLTDVLKEIAPRFEAQLLGAFGESTLSAMGEAIARSSSNECDERALLETAALAFITAIAESHSATLEPDRMHALAVDASNLGGSLRTTDDRRRFYGQLLERVDVELGTETTREVAEACRVIATSDAGLGLGGEFAPAAASQPGEVSAGSARFIDTEFVAIYW